jgi:hypothetical protein
MQPKTGCERLRSGDGRGLWLGGVLPMLFCAVPAWATDCPSRLSPTADLERLRESVAPAAEHERERRTDALVACLASPDPEMRDGLALATLQRWMRAGAYRPDELHALRERLNAMLDAPDPQGVARPFAALMLSEVARTDRISPWMRDDERDVMVVRAAEFLSAVTDYRGYETDVGWRHGVAHGADWAMQLALNPALTRAQLDRLRDAVASQAVPTAAHAYAFGESERLARSLLFIAQRDLHTEAEWKAWFDGLSQRLGEPAAAWKDVGWLARRHDLAAFLQVLYVNGDLSDDPGIARLKPGLLEALKALP